MKPFWVLIVATIWAQTALIATQFITITNPAPESEAYFGSSIAAVGQDKLVVAARYEEYAPSARGVVRLFDAQGILLNTFTNPFPETSSFGDAVAGVGGDKVLIGAPYDRTGADAAGAAFLFDLQGNLLNTFTNPTPSAGEFFGIAVKDFGSNRVLITSWPGGSYSGEVYLFDLQATLLTTFTNPTPFAGQDFGCSVDAVGEDRVIIGTWGGNAAGEGAFLFDLHGQLLTTFTNPAANLSGPLYAGEFGFPVAGVGDDKVLVGNCQGVAGTTAQAGAVYLFDLQGNLLTTFVSPSPLWGDNFGYAFAPMGTNRVVIGAYYAGYTGKAYVYDLSGVLLDVITNPAIAPSSGDDFGFSVKALGTNKVVIGARGDSALDYRAGAAYVFDFVANSPTLRIFSTATNTVVLSWESPATGYVLQQNDNISTANWTQVAQSPTDDSTKKWVMIPQEAGSRFYRLTK